MLSSHAVKILYAMKRTSNWVYQTEIQNQVKDFDYSAFKALLNGGYIDATVFEDEEPDYDNYGEIVFQQHYHISDKGLAHLEKLSAEKWVNFRSWVALAIALLAMIISALALVRSW